MRFARLVLESFGAFTGASFTFAPGFNLFFGENEEGKSTLIDALLMGLVGAPANAAVRQRYAPVDGRPFRLTLFVISSSGLSFRLERDLGPEGYERVYLREGETWLAGRRASTAWKELGLPGFDLARATAVISGSEVVLATKEAGAVGRAISARVTGGEGTVSGRQAKNRLDERRRVLENKERRELEDRLRELRIKVEAFRTAEETRRQLEATRRRAREELEAARALHAAYGPAVEAFEAMVRARQNYEAAKDRHATVFADLRAIRACEEEIARLEEELAPFSPCGTALTGPSKTRIHRLTGLVEAAREAAAKNAVARARLEEEVASLRARLEAAREAGFTPERARELDRTGAALDLAHQNLREKEAALKGPTVKRAGFLPLTVALLLGAAAAGLGFLTRRTWPWMFLVLLALPLMGWWFWDRSRRNFWREALWRAREEAYRELEMVRTAFLALSGGLERETWQREYAEVSHLAEELREKEARLALLAATAGDAEKEEAELNALLAAAGCRNPTEFMEKAGRFEELQKRLAERKAVRDSLLRGKEMKAWEEEERELARQVAVAEAVLQEAQKKAVGLDPATIARYREELAAADLAALERRFIEAQTAHEQHLKSAMSDAWEVETEIALLEEALARNRRRATAIRLAMEVLEEAISEVQASLVPRIRDRAGEFFRHLTGGRYDGLVLASGAELLEVAPCREEEVLPLRILSSGTLDQMYLALRLALVEALEGTEPFPLIFDDPFLTFDRTRSTQAMTLLGRLASTRQVVLVTKDETLRDLALAHGARMVERE
ncbi:MAG: AAA family ATPase [Firmicutes bacterium]|nr:AAA family ATPase [Bacillota bacterium]